MICSACGEAVSPTDLACRRCGAPVGSPPISPGARTYSTVGLAGVAAAAVLVVVLAALVIAVWPLVGGEMAKRALVADDPNLLTQAVLLELLLAVGYVVILITAAVLVIVWCYRARKNLDAFPGAETTMGAGWAIAGWLIPIVNFVVPYRVLANLARASLFRSTTPALVGIWWAAWLLGNIIDRFVARRDTAAFEALPNVLSSPSDYQRYVEYYEAALAPNLVPFALTATAGVIFGVLIMQISRAQQARIDRAQSFFPPLPSQYAGELDQSHQNRHIG